MPPQAESLALALLESWNERNLDAFASLLAEDVSWYDPSMPHPPATGRPAVMEFARSVLAAFPDFAYTIRSPICVAADGGSCAIPWRITATQTGPLEPLGFAPTGRRLSFEGVDLLFVRDGLIVRIETLFDAFAAASQALGVNLRPAAGSFSERLLVGAQRLRAAWLRRNGD